MEHGDVLRGVRLLRTFCGLMSGVGGTVGGMSDINVPIPDDASPEEEKRLIDRAINKKIDDELDDVFKDFPTKF